MIVYAAVNKSNYLCICALECRKAYLIAGVTGITRACFVLACLFCSGGRACTFGMNIWDVNLRVCVSLQYRTVTGALLSLWCCAWPWRQEDNSSSVGLWRSQMMRRVSYWVSSLSQEDLHRLISPCSLPHLEHQTHRAQWAAIKKQPQHIINALTVFTVLRHNAECKGDSSLKLKGFCL